MCCSGNSVLEAMGLTAVKDRLFDLFSGGVTAVAEISSDVLNDFISYECGEAFDQDIEIGIENTIRALIDASVHEDKMIAAMQKTWGLSREESAHRIGWIKRNIALERLEEYLLCKGNSKNAVNEFREQYSVIFRLSHEDSLIGLWDKPGQLYAKLLELGKNPRPKVHLVR